jgi:hypothetical protein
MIFGIRFGKDRITKSISDLSEQLAAAKEENNRLKTALAEAEELRDAAIGFTELDIHSVNGMTDITARADFVKNMAIIYYNVFMESGGKNFVEFSVFPPPEIAGESFGRLCMRLYRESGETPAMQSVRVREFWERRFQEVTPEQVKAGNRYYFVIRKEYELNEELARANVGIAIFYNKVMYLEWCDLTGRGGPGGSADSFWIPATSANIFQIFEIYYPDEARPERLPNTGDKVQFIADTILPSEDGVNMFQRIAVGTIGIIVPRYVNMEKRYTVRLPDTDTVLPLSLSPDEEIPRYIEKVS